MKKIKGKLLMTAAEIDLVLARISAEIVEKLGPQDEFAIIGIRRRGVPLAERLRKKLEATLKRAIPFGILDINLYRDDLTTISNRPMLRETLIDFDINDLSVVLVDDVLYTGRTIRAALDGIVDLGRPKKVQLAVLVDRGLRELPIQADYVGKYIQTSDEEIVEVRLEEEDQEERVVLLKMEDCSLQTEGLPVRDFEFYSAACKQFDSGCAALGECHGIPPPQRSSRNRTALS
jgi:pyrimidine operon attenuation protein/uracil phosphoribosyltransferase